MAERKNFDVNVKIAEQAKISLENGVITATGPKGSVSRNFMHPIIKIELAGGIIAIKSLKPKPSQVDKRLIRTFESHILNMIEGVLHGFYAKLKICSGHFPMSVSVEGNQVIIKNFFGEKIPRRAKIIDGADVKIDGDVIIVSGLDKERVGQTVAAIEQATKISGRDRRRFQDGCFITTSARVAND